MSINNSFVIESKFFDWGKWWGDMSSIQRQNWLRFWRLQRIEELKQEERDQKLQDYFLEQWLNKEDS